MRRSLARGSELKAFPLCSQILTLKRSSVVKCLNISLLPQLRNRQIYCGMFASNTDTVNRIIVAEILDYVTETSS